MTPPSGSGTWVGSWVRLARPGRDRQGGLQEEGQGRRGHQDARLEEADGEPAQAQAARGSEDAEPAPADEDKENLRLCNLLQRVPEEVRHRGSQYAVLRYHQTGGGGLADVRRVRETDLRGKGPEVQR